MTRRRARPVDPPAPLVAALEMLTSDEASVWELAVLLHVATAPGCSLRDVAARWSAAKSSIARACTALEERSCLLREPRADQLVSLTLTPAGRALARRLHIPA